MPKTTLGRMPRDAIRMLEIPRPSRQIIDAFKARFAAKVETVTTAEESVAFKLPRELRDMPAF